MKLITIETKDIKQYSIGFFAEYFNIEKDPDWTPITYSEIAKEQRSDALLKKLLKLDN